MLGNILSNKLKVRFLNGGFTSPVLGNVWAGRVATLQKKTAQAYINNGDAELVTDDDEQDSHPDRAPAETKVEKPADDDTLDDETGDDAGAAGGDDVNPPQKEPKNDRDSKPKRGKGARKGHAK